MQKSFYAQRAVEIPMAFIICDLPFLTLWLWQVPSRSQQCLSSLGSSTQQPWLSLEATFVKVSHKLWETRGRGRTGTWFFKKVIKRIYFVTDQRTVWFFWASFECVHESSLLTPTACELKEGSRGKRETWNSSLAIGKAHGEYKATWFNEKNPAPLKLSGWEKLNWGQQVAPPLTLWHRQIWQSSSAARLKLDWKSLLNRRQKYRNKCTRTVN